jgi:hypothetical protein
VFDGISNGENDADVPCDMGEFWFNVTVVEAYAETSPLSSPT